MPTTSQPILVLGAGIAGLAAAEEACRLGRTPWVLDPARVPGGLLRTDEREGFRFDRGGHRFITAMPWVLERVRSRVGERFLVRDRRSVVLLDGTRIEYPLGFGNLLSRLGPWQNLRAVSSYAVSRWRHRHLPENTLEEWLRKRFGDYLYRRVFEGYSAKLWGRHPREISAEWAPERISIPDLGGFLRELVRPSRQPPRTYARRFLYPRHGIGEIPDSFARAVHAAGGRVETGAVPIALRRRAHGWQVAFRRLECGTVEEQAVEAVVSTIPLQALVELLDVADRPVADPEPFPYRALRFTNLGFARPVPLDTTWLYQPDPRCRFTRIQVPAARSPEMAPMGCGSFQLEEPLEPGADVDAEPPIAAALATLRSAGFAVDDPIVAFSTIEPHAYPAYRSGARARAAALAAMLESLPGLAVAGRQGRFSYVFLDRALAEGVNAVRRLHGLAPYPLAASTGRPLPVEAQSIIEEALASTETGS